ncbi:hypothetical protein [Clostridium butyricum]
MDLGNSGNNRSFVGDGTGAQRNIRSIYGRYSSNNDNIYMKKICPLKNTYTGYSYTRHLIILD